ncbi:hypothetical protein [Geodermatophilus sp. SYSU D00684]
MVKSPCCRWCRSTTGTTVLDLGRQPSSDAFPQPGDPPPALHPLRLWRCDECSLVQLPDHSPAPEEPRAREPAALRDHARDSVDWAGAVGLLAPGATVREFGSPHGGSWLVPLSSAGLEVLSAADGPADVVVDVFGLMHEEDQRAGLQRRVDALAPGGVLVLVFPPLETLVAHAQWNAVRHGHHAYPSTAVAADQVSECGLTVVASALHHLYGGTRLLAARPTAAVPADHRPPPLPADVPPTGLATLADGVEATVTALRARLQGHADAGRKVLGYGAASRAVPLLVAAAVGPELLPAVADASREKQGRLIPAVGIPVISPAALVAAGPDEVLLFLPDLLEEVRADLPDVERAGGAWFTVDALFHGGGTL